MTSAPAIARDLAPAALALARRFGAGATLWCLSSQWPAHAQHVAVEFVHPVIVGKRALPAVAIESPDPLPALRVNVRSGDVILAIAPADDPVVGDIFRRAGAWGATTVWVGAGSTRPPSGAADHVLWIDEEPATAAASFVRSYHLLWELAHVCFEHPGLLKEQEPACTEEVCITCSDEGRLAEVVAARGDEATVRTATGTEQVDGTLVGPVRPGDLLLVHAGTAITSLSEERSS